MSGPVEVEVVIARRREDVAAHVMDPANDTTWIRALTDVRVETDGALGEGTRVRRVARFLGRSMEYVLEVVEHEPPRRLAMRSVEGPFAMTVAYELDELHEGTRMRVVTAGEGGAFYRLAGPLLDRQVRRSIEGDLEQLKQVLERGSG